MYFTYSLTPWYRVLLEKLTGLQLVKKFSAFHGTRMFITALTSVRHLSLSWASPIHSIHPHPTSWRSVLISSTHLRLGLPSVLLPSDFPSKTLYTPFSSPIRATCPANLILLYFVTRTILGEGALPLPFLYLCRQNWIRHCFSLLYDTIQCPPESDTTQNYLFSILSFLFTENAAMRIYQDCFSVRLRAYCLLHSDEVVNG